MMYALVIDPLFTQSTEQSTIMKHKKDESVGLE